MGTSVSGRIAGFIGWYAIPVVLYGFIRYVIMSILPGHSAIQGMDLWYDRNLAIAGPGLWWFLLIWSIIGAVTLGFGEAEADDGWYILSPLCAVLAIVSLITGIVKAVNADKDYESYYAKSVTFYVPDPKHLPDSLSRLTNGGTKTTANCAVVSKASDVPNCVKQGTLSNDGWDPRVSSLDGAKYGLTHSASFKQHVNLDSTTLKYLNAWHGQPARWSGILDGSGSNVHLGGVAEWDGHRVIQQCDFTGQYGINRAFSGDSMNDLGDLLAEKFHDYYFTMSDVWGYCDGNQPIIIVPMQQQESYAGRTVDGPAGFVIVQGNHGKVKFTRKTSAAPGEYPGPVYPSSLVDDQLSASEWAAGRKNQDQNGFGYEPASSAAQAGNVSDYLLRDKVTGRLEWVTPLTLRNTSSEIFVAYAVSYADQLTDGKLNPLSIYVLGSKDSRRINIDNMESDARNYLAQNAPGFISSGGKLLEFTPVGGNIWRAYAEINGRVEYLLDIDATNVSASVLTNIGGSADTGTGGKPGAPTNTVCGKPLSGLTDSQLANCLKQLADELATRSGNGTTPSK